MKTIMILIAMLLIGGGILYAKGKVVKTDDGFKIKTGHTYYENKVSWGEGYNDHVVDTPITGIAVLAVGAGWTYSTVTDATGNFKVKVEPLKPFKLRISDGNTWIDYETEIAGIPEGTTLNDIK